MEKSLQEKEVRKNTSVKSLGSCYRVERRVYSKKGESVFIVKRREGVDTGIHGGPAKKRVHPTL